MQNNEAPDTKICLIREDFRDAMIGGSGFVWANDQPEGATPKVGRRCCSGLSTVSSPYCYCASAVTQPLCVASVLPHVTDASRPAVAYGDTLSMSLQWVAVGLDFCMMTAALSSSASAFAAVGVRWRHSRGDHRPATRQHLDWPGRRHAHAHCPQPSQELRAHGEGRCVG